MCPKWPHIQSQQKVDHMVIIIQKVCMSKVLELQGVGFASYPATQSSYYVIRCEFVSMLIDEGRGQLKAIKKTSGVSY